MPELPELEVIKDNLSFQIVDKVVKQLQILKPYVLKNYFHGDLKGEKVEDIRRKGKFIIIELSKHKIVTHLMLRGSIKYVLPGVKIKTWAASLVVFSDGTLLEISETGSKKRMSIYILSKNKLLKQIENLGVDPLENDFTVERLRKLLSAESKQIKSFLRSQKKIAGIGNAYADEILWTAKLSPFKLTTQLSAKQIKGLYRSINRILKWAIQEIKDRGVSEKRKFLNIHRKKGEPCPRCGLSVQRISFSNSETYYCPKCQTQCKKLKDRRMSKFYR